MLHGALQLESAELEVELERYENNIQRASSSISY